MKLIEDFLKQCDGFMVITNNHPFPAARPFGIAMAQNDKLYLCTNKQKDVYKQIVNDNHLQIVGKKINSREWIRVNALAKPDDNMDLKTEMFKQYPLLKSIYDNPQNPLFVLLELDIKDYEIVNGWKTIGHK